ncbi:MAG: MarR family winged helix-turn-helix transcriptional regulator [Draconibacterium sp.]
MEINLEQSVNHRVATLAVLLKRQVFRIIAENKLEITPDQWVILYYLWQSNGLTVGELAKSSKKDFANVTRIVDKLEKLGYVTKKKSPADSRSVLVFILPKADGIKDKVYACMQQSINIATNGLTQSEQVLMLGLIEKMEANILNFLE